MEPLYFIFQILTAAHCFPDIHSWLYIWDIDVYFTNKVKQTIPTRNVKCHESYDRPKQYQNDICLIRLKTAMNDITPLNIGHRIGGNYRYAIGLSTSSTKYETRNFRDHMLRAKAQTITKGTNNNQICPNVENTICVKLESGNAWVTEGDSGNIFTKKLTKFSKLKYFFFATGGPIYKTDTETNTAVGIIIVSHFNKEGIPFAICTSISDFQNWINRKMDEFDNDESEALAEPDEDDSNEESFAATALISDINEWEAFKVIQIELIFHWHFN